MGDKTTQTQEINWLTLSEAQALLRVSRKTLYRYMDKKLLNYKKAANGRRYLSEEHIHIFIDQQIAVTKETYTEKANEKGCSEVYKQLAMLNTKVEKQNQILETLIKLYKPESMRELLLKLKH